MTRWLRHPLFAPILALAALGWGTLLIVFLIVGPALGGWAATVLTLCFGWSATARAYRLDAVLLVTLEPPLFVAVVGLFYADELRAFLRRRGGRVVTAGAALGFVATAAVLLSSGDVVSGRPREAGAMPVRDGRIAPWEPLTDQRGVVVDARALRGRPVALTFVYTNCHATCPALVATLRAAEALVGDRARFVAVTLDPERDTPAALAAYAERWNLGAAWYLLSGAPASVGRFRRAYGVAVERLPGGEIAHANVIVVIDRAGRLAYTYRGGGPSADVLAQALARLAGEPT